LRSVSQDICAVSPKRLQVLEREQFAECNESVERLHITESFLSLRKEMVTKMEALFDKFLLTGFYPCD
jgi:hypothetical protein